MAGEVIQITKIKSLQLVIENMKGEIMEELESELDRRRVGTYIFLIQQVLNIMNQMREYLISGIEDIITVGIVGNA